MASGFIVRLRPTGPWRLGPSSGARDRVDRVLHSDTLYSALTLAAQHIGILPEWLSVTAEAAQPVVRVASAFPFVGRTLLAPAPRHVWPPAASGRTRWKAARFVPLHMVPRLFAYEPLKEDRWAVDPVSEAVLPVEKFGEVNPPYRVTMRRTAAVDRITGVSAEPASTACLEFSENAGWWCAVFCPAEWTMRLQSLFRFIADAGIGGERSLGWGRSATPEFEDLPGALAQEPGQLAEHHERGYWLLSLVAPATSDRVAWGRGSYALVRRSGRTHDRGTLKIESAMVEEGSVVMADAHPAGVARDIAGEGAEHPIYRAGFAVAVPVPVRLPGFYERERATTAENTSVETPAEAAAAITTALEDLAELAAGESEIDKITHSAASQPALSQPAHAESTSTSGQATDVVSPLSIAEADEVPFEDATAAPGASSAITDAGGPGEPPSELLTDSSATHSSNSEQEHAPEQADEIPFADAISDNSATSEIADEDGPPQSVAETDLAEAVEDQLSVPAAVPDPEYFVAETASEQVPTSGAADGGAFEDGPASPDADADDPKDAG